MHFKNIQSNSSLIISFPLIISILYKYVQKIVSGREESVVFGRVRCSSGLFYQYPGPLPPLLLFLWISLQYPVVIIILLSLCIFLYLLFVITQPSSKVLLFFNPCYCCYLKCVFFLILSHCSGLCCSTILKSTCLTVSRLTEHCRKYLRLCYQMRGSVVFHYS